MEKTAGARSDAVRAVTEAGSRLDTERFLEMVGGEFGGDMVFATSMGAEDQVLTDMIVRYAPQTHLITLDTGRLPAETYELIERTSERYGVTISQLHPDSEELRQLTDEHGPNSFYRSVELRKRCCYVRKVAPLRRELTKYRAWMTGMRREQSLTRQDIAIAEYDADNDAMKINPLLEWGHEEIWSYIRTHAVPYSALHDQGYPSIGCAPCTRAILAGESERAGRWWWEEPNQRECGLHVKRT